MYNKKIIEEWLEFRKTKMEELTAEDKTHIIDMDKLFKSMQNLVPIENQNLVLNKIDELIDVIVKYTEYSNDKFYKIGFYDAINLVIMGGTKNVIK